MGRYPQRLHPAGQAGCGYGLAGIGGSGIPGGRRPLPGLEIVVNQESRQGQQHDDINIADNRAGQAGHFQGIVQAFRQIHRRHAAGYHQDAELEIDIAQAPVLEHIDDGGTHYQGQAGADGVAFRHTEHNQPAGYQKPAAHAEKPAQGADNQPQQDEQDGMNHHLGVGKEHRLMPFRSRPVAGGRAAAEGPPQEPQNQLPEEMQGQAAYGHRRHHQQSPQQGVAGAETSQKVGKGFVHSGD